jgi:hypothetical protein
MMRFWRRRPAPVSRSRSRAADPRIGELEQRLDALELALEGLQDAVYRASVRQDREIRDLNANTQPGAMARALSEDARRRGV